MFEGAEIGSKVSKAEYEARVPQLRVDLVNAQYDLQTADFPVIVLVTGDHQLACRQTLRGMHEWMDGRYIETHVFGEPSDEERRRPTFWRYWRRLPRHGRIGAFLNGWVTDPIRETVGTDARTHAFDRHLEHIRRFEEELVQDGTLLIKLWLHIPKAHFKKLVSRLKKKREDWRLQKSDYEIFEHYDQLLPVSEQLLEKTSTGISPWHVVESTNRRYAGLAVGSLLLEALQRRLATRPEAPPPPPGPAAFEEKRSLLATVDLSQSLDEDRYETRLLKLQAKLRKLSNKASQRSIASTLVFEGWDAAGKGGVIRRLTAALDIRDFRIVPIAAPTEEERKHHYLWRFWNHVPAPGKTVVFDRSWYGRVLVERVEGLAREDEWRRAYAEIRDFEDQLAEGGISVLKFWLHIDPDEQLRRFHAREQTAFKKYKITDEDYRNREKWSDYERAVDEMVERTSTHVAPWHLIPANDKRFARVRVLELCIDTLRARLKKTEDSR